MHLGNARTALLAWLQVRASGGAMVMRIEDLDPGRSRKAYEACLLDDLQWLGLDWDEGPDVGGPYGPYRQSERSAVYRDALDRLDVYPCTCTRREVRAATFAPAGAEPVYPGTCRTGVAHPDRPEAIRWRVPAGIVAFEDALVGARVEDVAKTAGDFVLRRGDGAYAYQLAVVVDDAAMGITHVLRGEDLLDSTARQIMLQRALGYTTPSYVHVPLVLGPDGVKLSKRHDAPDLAALRDGGVDPGRVIAMLARSLGLVGSGVRSVRAEELARDFDVARLKVATRAPLDLACLR